MWANTRLILKWRRQGGKLRLSNKHKGTQSPSFRSYLWRQLTIRRLKMKLIFVGSSNLSDVLPFFLITDYKYELLSGPAGTETSRGQEWRRAEKDLEGSVKLNGHKIRSVAVFKP